MIYLQAQNRGWKAIARSLGGKMDLNCQKAAAAQFFTGFLPHGYDHSIANPAKTVLAGATFRFNALRRPVF